MIVRRFKPSGDDSPSPEGEGRGEGELISSRVREALTIRFMVGERLTDFFRERSSASYNPEWVRRAFLQFIENRIAHTSRVAPQMRITKAKRLDAARF